MSKPEKPAVKKSERPAIAPWNKDKSVGQMTPLRPQQVQTIKHLLEAEDNPRDLALFAVAIDTMLRGVDLLALTVNDVTDHEGRIRDEFVVRQQKTGKGTLVSLTPYAQKALAQWIAASRKSPWALLFTRLRGDPDQAISTYHYRTLVKKWVGYARLDPANYSSHSLRRTKAAIIYEQTRNVEAVRELLGQNTISATSAYLGVGKRQAIEISKQIVI